MKIALAGNPNAGKTTLFNALTGSNQYVGNWPGVTVEKKEGRLKGHRDVVIQDLPGIYSLSPYTPEEVVSRRYLAEERPEVILDIVDGTNLERNLYLTTQLLELDIPVVVAVNMMDLVDKAGDKIDLKELGRVLGCRVVPLSAVSGGGTDGVVQATLEAGEAGGGQPLPKELGALLAKARADQEDPDEAEAAARYDFIVDRAMAAARKSGKGKLTPSQRIDRVVTNRVAALPIFFAVMFLVYAIAMGPWPFSIGARLTDLVNDVVVEEWAKGGAEALLTGWGWAPWLIGLIVDGVIGGVGAVIGFLPQILVLFLMLSILEDIGYMARIAFIMDRLFRRFGLSGKSFISLLVGMGCSVPGIMAARTIASERDRRMTVMTTSFIPCSAKTPVVALFAGAIFGGSALVATSAYFIGIGAVVVSGIILKKTRPFAGEPAPFVMELPAYHVPSARGVFRATWDRGWSFAKRAGTVILVSSIVLWFLQGFGFAEGVFGLVEDNDQSILAAIGRGIAWVFAPLGFGTWQATVATFTGLIAKEEVVSTFGVLYAGEELAVHFTPLAAYSFMIFNLLCAPCFAAMGAIRREMNSAKWTAGAIGYLCGFAYVVSLIVYQFGMAFTGGASWPGLIAAAVCLGAMVFLLVRPNRHKGLRPAPLREEPVSGSGWRCTGDCARCKDKDHR